MIRLLTAVFTLALTAGPTAQEPAPPRFKDPAPPRVADLPEVAAPQAEAYPELRFVAAPKALPAGAIVEDWPGFLGPRRDGRSRETKLLSKWPDGGPRLVWSMVRGQGYASPAVARGRVVYPHRVRNETFIDCLEAETGRRFWRARYRTNYKGRYISDSGPRATPLIDGDRVYVHGVEGWLHCLELDTGRVLWKRDLAADFKLKDGFFGVVSSPLVFGDLLIINLGAPGGPSVAAFDKLRGHLVWGAGNVWGMSCASPVLGEVRGKTRLFVLTGGESRPATGGLMVIDPATGAVEHEYPFRSRIYESVNGASPVVADNRVFLTASYGTGSAALEADAKGRFDVLWKQRRFGLEFATPLYVNDHLWAVVGVRERAGGIVCVDPKTGEELSRTDLAWEEDVPYQGKTINNSFSVGNGCMIWADGAFLCLSDYGHLLRLDCKPDRAVVKDRATLFLASESWTPPVLSHGLLYVCQNRRERFGTEPPRLLCFDLRADS